MRRLAKSTPIGSTRSYTWFWGSEARRESRGVLARTLELADTFSADTGEGYIWTCAANPNLGMTLGSNPESLDNLEDHERQVLAFAGMRPKVIDIETVRIAVLL